MAADPRGRTLGHFVVEDELGRGGMGVVLLARQDSLDRLAVLKKVRRDITEFPELAERFEREAQAAASVHHQNVVAVYDYFSFRSDQYIAQEYVDGLDLRTVLDRSGPLPWRIAAIIALNVAYGLEELHGRGIIHRDLKPANILLGRRGEIKIADFGLALDTSGPVLTQPGIMLGSLSYMPPEQMMAERVDARGDLFSLGVCFYEMLCGRAPYLECKEEEAESLLVRMQKERYASLRKAAARRVPTAIRRLIRSCLRGKVRKRPSSAMRFRRVLETKLGNPSPSDARNELASWLWERQVFDTKDKETVLLVRDSGALSWRPTRSLTLAVGAAIVLAVLATFGYVEVTPELQDIAAQLNVMSLGFPN